MPLKKIVIIILFSGLFSTISKAQSKNLQLGVSANETYFGKDLSFFNTGAQLSISTFFSDKFGLSANYAYYFPYEKSGKEGTLNYQKSANISVFSIDGQIYLYKSYLDDFGIYVPLGISYLSGSYLNNMVSPNGNFNQEENLNGLGLDLGVGVHFKVNKPIFFIEFKGAIPPGVSNFEQSFNPIRNTPFQATLMFGIKIPFEFISNPYIQKSR